MDAVKPSDVAANVSSAAKASMGLGLGAYAMAVLIPPLLASAGLDVGPILSIMLILVGSFYAIMYPAMRGSLCSRRGERNARRTWWTIAAANGLVAATTLAFVLNMF